MPRILIIDDDDAVRRSTKIMLSAHGYEVVGVADGKAGLNALAGSKFDVVIVDLFMAGMNGMETMRAIRHLNQKIPMIALSGFMFNGRCPDMPNYEDMAVEAGATSALYKPIRPAEFLRALRDSIEAVA
jgi:CheY-like chemotaxis protein